MNNEEICKEMYKQWKRLNATVNKVTAQYKHGTKVTDRALYELSERQIDTEEQMVKLNSLIKNEK